MAQESSPTPIKRTGSIWKKPSAQRSRIVKRVCDALSRTYGNPRFGNPSDPLDDLIYIVLSNKTAPQASRRVYRRLRRRFRTWDEVLRAPASALRSLLRPAGLSAVKSRHIRAALGAIKARFGSCDLRSLKHGAPGAVQAYLVGLPGVSEKVAKCVMMYTLNLPVLPVDAHVHRIACRLGWTARKRADQCHPELEALVPQRLRSGFHVSCIAHGRAACRPSRPVCNSCCVNRYCEFFKASQ